MSAKKFSIYLLSLFVLLFFTAFCLISCSSDGGKAYEKTIFVMDSIATLRADEKYVKPLEEILKSLSDELSMLDESDISRLNEQGEGTLSQNAFGLVTAVAELSDKCQNVDISCGALSYLWKTSLERGAAPDDEEIAEAMAKCGADKLTVDPNELSVTLKGGAMLDFGACAKGYALDLCYASLEEQGAEYALLTLGSSTLLYGEKPDSKPFSVGVRDPLGEGLALVFETAQAFVSTSGGYERGIETDGVFYDHILDLKTGRPVETDLLSVTVICDNGTLSDLMATEIYITGVEGLSAHLLSEEYMVIAIARDKTVYASEGIKDKITIKNSNYRLG